MFIFDSFCRYKGMKFLTKDYFKVVQLFGGSGNSVGHINQEGWEMKITSSLCQGYVVLVLNTIYGRARFDRAKEIQIQRLAFSISKRYSSEQIIFARIGREAIDRRGSRMTGAVLAFQREAWANDACECTMIECNWAKIAWVNNREWTKMNRERLRVKHAILQTSLHDLDI